MMVDYSKLPHNHILCVDMRAFYASCEAVAMGLDPNSCYLAVVGDVNISSSIVLATSPMLKKDFSIATGNRLFEIPKNKNIHIVGARMALYLDISMDIAKIFYRYVGLEDIHIYSVDEAWLKVDGSTQLFGDEFQIAGKIKDDILSELGLHCAIGIGPNRFLSKVCLDNEAKKVGISSWDYKDVASKLWPLNVDKCWGIGRAMTKRLGDLGIKTLGDLAHFPLDILESKFGIMGNQLFYHSWGVDLSTINSNIDYSIPKSIGKGITLDKDYKDLNSIYIVILELCEDICYRARGQALAGRTIHLSLSYSKAQGGGGLSHSLTMANPSNLTMDIFNLCKEILKKHNPSRWVKKMSLSLGNLSPDQELQLDFFYSKEKERKLSMIMDEIKSKYGKTSIVRACSLNRDAISFKQQNKIGGHNS